MCWRSFLALYSFIMEQYIKCNVQLFSLTNSVLLLKRLTAI